MITENKNPLYRHQIDNIRLGKLPSKEQQLSRTQHFILSSHAAMFVLHTQYGPCGIPLTPMIRHDDRIISYQQNTLEHRRTSTNSQRFKTNRMSFEKRRAKIHRYSFLPIGILYSSNSSRKLLIQELWASEKEWDKKLEEEMLHKWVKSRKENGCISMVTILRFIGNSNCQLLCFCDASAKAYALLST